MKKILYVLVGLVVVYLILCIAGPAKMKVERSIDINASADLVRSKIPDHKLFHSAWSPWTKLDPNMKVTYTGEVGTPGSKMAWESDVKDVGKGSMTYNATNGDTVIQTLHFDDFGDSKIYFIVTAAGNASKVTWGILGDYAFMQRGIMLFMNMDKMMGPHFEEGLTKLKSTMEGMATATPAANYEVKELTWDAKTFYGKKETLSFDKMAAFFGENYGKIAKDLATAKIAPVGQPKAIYFTFDEKTMISECAAVMEVANGTNLKGWEKFETPAGKVLLIEYYGSYDKSAAAHYAMDAYMKKNNLTQSVVLEEYVTDPMTEKDTAKWLTNVFYIIK